MFPTTSNPTAQSKKQMDYLIEHPWQARNVFIKFGDNILALQGGLYASSHLTNAELSKMIRIVFHAEGAFSIHFERTGFELPNNQQPVQHGSYILRPLKPGASIHATGELILDRKLDSRSGSPDFIQRVKERDYGYCTIMGALRPDQYTGGPATKFAYLFPSGQGMVFSLLPFPIPPEGVHSAQNVISVEEPVYQAWEAGQIAIDPDDDYRIISFHPNTQHCHGIDLHPVCREHGDIGRVNDDLLRWHYRQTVIKNLRGDGKDHRRYPGPSDITATNSLVLPYDIRGDQVCKPSSTHGGPNNGPLRPPNRDRKPINESRQPMDNNRESVRKPEEKLNQSGPASVQHKEPTNIPDVNPRKGIIKYADIDQQIRKKNTGKLGVDTGKRGSQTGKHVRFE